MIRHDREHAPRCRQAWASAASHLAAMGVDRYLRDTVAGLELTVAALLLARTSGYLLHGLVAAVSVVEVALMHWAPLAAVACLTIHGLSTWARSAYDRGRMLGPSPAPNAGVIRPRHLHYALHTFGTRANVVRPKSRATGQHTAHAVSRPPSEPRSDTH